MLPVLLQGMGVGIALAAPIGPINVEIIRRGLGGGFVNGWLVGIGAVLADTILCALVVSGVAPLADRPLLRIPLFLLGAAVLLFLGIGGLRAVRRGAAFEVAPASGRRSLATGFLMAASNPMGIVYWLSIGSALIASAIEHGGRAAGPILIGGVFVGIVVWGTVLSGLTQAGRSFVSPRVMRGIGAFSAAMLVGFGLWFAWQGIAGLASL
jgi:threonine/homoserine/homoserine lactone efflux protein